MWFFPFCQETEDERRRISGWIEWEEKKLLSFFGGNRGSGFSFKGEKFHLLGENWKMWHKAPIRYSDESKSPRAALLNFRRDLFKKKKNPFFFFFLFFLSVWVTAFIIFQKQSWSKQLTDKRGFSHDTFLGSAVPQDQSSILWMDKHTISPREKISK